ncbi:MAG: pyrrolo-quinoline quinone [Opitutus sp.]|nr:pyrrolo-quinoline quinone [Opitutus sp.]
MASSLQPNPSREKPASPGAASITRRGFLGLSVLLCARRGVAAEASNWPAFRGPLSSGVADAFPLPTEWRVKWKAPVAGLGHSSPVIWGNRLFVATAVSASGHHPIKLGLYGERDAAEETGEQSWQVFCFDKRTGKLLWEHTAHKAIPRTQRHRKATQANTTLSTDGKVLVAFFGSEGLHCYNLDGERLWTKNLGAINVSKYGVGWGYASSPTLHDGTILLQCDAPDNPFLTAIRASDGEELWRTKRSDVCERCWATPFVDTQGGRQQVVANGWPYVVSYDLRTGKELWRLKAGGDNPIPTPFSAHGLIYVANGHGASAPVWAIRPDASGDITLAAGERSNAFIAWSDRASGAYIQTPLVYRDCLYSGSNSGVLKCYDAMTGNVHYQERLVPAAAGFSASPVAGDGKIYCASEQGEVHVLAAGPVFKKLAVNRVEGSLMATPAISEGTLYFRTLDSLIAVG